MRVDYAKPNIYAAMSKLLQEGSTPKCRVLCYVFAVNILSNFLLADFVAEILLDYDQEHQSGAVV